MRSRFLRAFSLFLAIGASATCSQQGRVELTPTKPIRHSDFGEGPGGRTLHNDHSVELASYFDQGYDLFAADSTERDSEKKDREYLLLPKFGSQDPLIRLAQRNRDIEFEAELWSGEAAIGDNQARQSIKIVGAISEDFLPESSACRGFLRCALIEETESDSFQIESHIERQYLIKIDQERAFKTKSTIGRNEVEFRQLNFHMPGWQELEVSAGSPPPPLSASISYVLGDELLVWGYAPRSNALVGARYSLMTKDWVAFPDAALVPSADIVFARQGDGFVVHNGREGSVFDPGEGGAWVALPPVPEVAGDLVNVALASDGSRPYLALSTQIEEPGDDSVNTTVTVLALSGDNWEVLPATGNPPSAPVQSLYWFEEFGLVTWNARAEAGRRVFYPDVSSWTEPFFNLANGALHRLIPLGSTRFLYESADTSTIGVYNLGRRDWDVKKGSYLDGRVTAAAVDREVAYIAMRDRGEALLLDLEDGRHYIVPDPQAGPSNLVGYALHSYKGNLLAWGGCLIFDSDDGCLRYTNRAFSLKNTLVDPADDP